MPRRCTSPWWSAVLVAVVLAGLGGRARADEVDKLVGQLRSSDDYKVRLSAALGLSKLNDPRAIPAFLSALKDSDATVRGVAAAALGKLVTEDTAAADRKQVQAALKVAETGDKNAFVRSQSQKAYDRLKALGGATAVKAGGLYVNIGSMSDKTKGGSMASLMRKTVEKTIKKQASSMMTTWPTGKDPTASQLSAKKVTAFHVDGTLNEVTVDQAGSTANVSCKVSMLLATYPEKSMFGFLKGGAAVEAGTSSKEIQDAKEDCVNAVLEDLIARKIIPTIQARSP